MSEFLILSVKHSTKDRGFMLKWWGPDKRGYVERLAEAGRYSEGDAVGIVGFASGQRQSSVMVPVDNGALFLKGDITYAALEDSTHNMEALDALEIWEAYHGKGKVTG